MPEMASGAPACQQRGWSPSEAYACADTRASPRVSRHAWTAERSHLCVCGCRGRRWGGRGCIRAGRRNWAGAGPAAVALHLLLLQRAQQLLEVRRAAAQLLRDHGVGGCRWGLGRHEGWRFGIWGRGCRLFHASAIAAH